MEMPNPKKEIKVMLNQNKNTPKKPLYTPPSMTQQPKYDAPPPEKKKSFISSLVSVIVGDEDGSTTQVKKVNNPVKQEPDRIQEIEPIQETEDEQEINTFEPPTKTKSIPSKPVEENQVKEQITKNKSSTESPKKSTNQEPPKEKKVVLIYDRKLPSI